MITRVHSFSHILQLFSFPSYPFINIAATSLPRTQTAVRAHTKKEFLQLRLKSKDACVYFCLLLVYATHMPHELYRVLSLVMAWSSLCWSEILATSECYSNRIQQFIKKRWGTQARQEVKLQFHLRRHQWWHQVMDYQAAPTVGPWSSHLSFHHFYLEDRIRLYQKYFLKI